MKLNKSRLLARLLKRLKEPAKYKSLLNFLENDLEQLDGSALITKLIKAQVLYHSALPRITGNFLPINLDYSPSIGKTYTIAFHQQRGSLSSSYQHEILAGLEVLNRLSIADQDDDLSNFAKRFTKRFEGTEVPLLRALDPQSGVSYLGTEKSATEGDDLTDLSQARRQKGLKKSWTAVSALLLQKLSGFAADNRGMISFSEEEINQLPTSDQSGDFPSSLWVMFRQAGTHLYIENAGGNSALSIAGRFSHHPQILEELKAIASLEQKRNPDVAFAEVAAMDNSVSDNINSRGHLRDFEIPVLVHSDRLKKETILLNDLYVKVIGGRVILFSKRLNKIVIPRLSTAYNYKLSNLPLLRFLGDLQYQDLKYNFSFDPEFCLPGLRYYPRVVYKNIILSAAKWIWDINTIGDFRDPEQGLRKFYRMASATRLARLFALTSYDRQLVFDMSCEHSIRYFLQIIRNLSQVVLQEFFLPEDGAKIYDAKGQAHIGQFVAFLTNKDTVYSGQVFKKPDIVKNVKSVFFPGEEWLYFKIYAHPETLNLLLAEGSLHRVLQRFRKNDGINCWFFVRYADPEQHLRIRIKADLRFATQITAAISRIIKGQLRNGIITDFTIATYQPELERYGFAGMDEVEEVFELSSDAVLSFHSGANTFNDQICFAFSSVAEVLSVMFPALNDRLVFTTNMNQTIQKRTSRQVLLDKYYRQQKYHFASVVNDLEKYYGHFSVDKIRKLCEKCSNISNVRHLVSDDRYAQFVSDLIHMHLNRLNATASAEFECNVYYFLSKYYYSLKGREKRVFAEK